MPKVPEWRKYLEDQENNMKTILEENIRKVQERVDIRKKKQEEEERKKNQRILREQEKKIEEEKKKRRKEYKS